VGLQDEVVAHVRVPRSSRAVELTVTLKDGRLEVRSSQQGEGEAALAGELLHPVVEDDDKDGDVDWELTDWPTAAPLAGSSRRVTVTMRKARETRAYACERARAVSVGSPSAGDTRSC